MDIDVTVSGATPTRQSIKKIAEELGKDFTSIGIQEARGLAVELGRYTLPVGLSESSGNKLQERIRNDIRVMFPALSDGKVGATRIYGILEKVSKKLAERFWAKYEAGGIDGAEEFLSRRVQGLPRGVDKEADARRRRGKKSPEPTSVARQTVRDNYMKRRVKTAGMAKAGWLGAAKSLGGRVRRGGGRSGGTRATFPSYVRKAGARKKLGASRISSRNGVLRISLRNSVRHASEVLDVSLQQRAEGAAFRKFVRSLNRAVQFRAQSFKRRSRRRAA